MEISVLNSYTFVLERLEGLRDEAATERLAQALRTERKAVAMATPEPTQSDALRDWAREQIESRRRLRIRAAFFALAMVVLTPVWTASEYLSAGGWPQRLSGNGNPGDWDPWIIWVALAWGFYLALTTLVIQLRKPPVDDREIDQVLARFAGHGRT
jgi:2TM domain